MKIANSTREKEIGQSCSTYLWLPSTALLVSHLSCFLEAFSMNLVTFKMNFRDRCVLLIFTS